MSLFVLLTIILELRMLHKLVFIFVLLVSIHSFAQAESKEVEVQYSIKQIIKSHKLVVVQANGPTTFSKGKIFLATFPDGSQCSLVLQEVNKQLITLDSSSCDQPEKLNIKAAIEPSLVSEIKSVGIEKSEPVEKIVEQSGSSTSSKFGDHFALNIFYSLADQVKFKDAKYSDNSGSVSASTDFKTQGAVGIGFSYVRMEPQSWGFSAGGTIDGAREVKSI
ncbi:MAG: hypothetical protein J7501_14015, partial [Bdellovibrio sp.]|nr:hypothetical protein [Bdellovibrio sp.]